MVVSSVVGKDCVWNVWIQNWNVWIQNWNMQHADSFSELISFDRSEFNCLADENKKSEKKIDGNHHQKMED